MAVPIAPTPPPDRAAIKSAFANRAPRFVNRALALPGAVPILIGTLVALLFTTLAGAFGTGQMAFPNRLLFWATLLGLNAALYIAWFAWRVRQPSDWWPAAAIGMVALTVPLPFEIMIALGLATGQLPVLSLQSWRDGLAVGGALLALAAAMQFYWPRPTPSAAPVFTKGALWRHGVRAPGDIAAIVAEDHYCRLHFAHGESRLVYGRFADLVRELDGADGLVVRRGVWVAAAAVRSVEREARRLFLTLAHGDRVAVSPAGRSALRAAGWVEERR